jgi:Protein of unknown function with HXXEE motif
MIPTLLTLHNAEEAVAFRRAWSHMPQLLPEPFATFEARLPYAVIFQALVLLSLLAFLLAAVVMMRPRSRVALWLLLALEAAVAINVVAHVLTATFVFKGYGPGLATALILNAPFAWYALRQARNEAWVTRRAWHGLLLGGLVLHGPVLVAGLWLAAALLA